MNAFWSPSRRSFLSATAAAAMTTFTAPYSLAAGARVDRRAPAWDISEWINADPGNVDSLSGKVIVIDFFQLWCPGCNKFSGPLLTHWQQKFADSIADGQLILMKIHTVFEGHSYQTVRRLKSYIREKKIDLPVGVDRHADGERLPETMRRYRTRGTPEIAIIDRDGIIQFQEFGYFEPEPVEAMIQSMLVRTRA